ncbi:MAG: peptidoglycan recognition protein family protein, partial [Planctomycetota bacterium]|jgi:hypothetical protein
MTSGAIVLMALGNNPPSAGAFCLNTYNDLARVERVICSQGAHSPSRWTHIEIRYSGTKAGNIEQLTSLTGLASQDDINCHFLVCNGLGGQDGQIQPTRKWQMQWSIISGRDRLGSDRTIHICVIGDGKTAPPTDFQVRRAEELVDALYRRFNIRPESIKYPGDWQ